MEIISLHHDSPVAGHPGQWKTQELISRNYWWPGITIDVIKYVSGCDKCQRMKSFPEKPAGKLRPIERATRPWKDITTDFVTGLLEAQGFDALFVTCCRHTNRFMLFLRIRRSRPEALRYYLETMYGSFTVFLKRHYQIGDHSSWQDS